MEKLCKCGCGEVVKKINGFILGHQSRGERNCNWKGGKAFGGNSANYVMIKKYGHPRARPDGYVYEHILMAEEAMGKSLPLGAEIHHFNGYENKKGNLVICQDRAYHELLHQRKRAYDVCGNASWRKCWICKEYDDVENMIKYCSNTTYHHMECQKKYTKEYYEKNKKYINEYSKQYKQNNKEAIKKIAEKYRETNREHINAKRRLKRYAEKSI